MKTASTKRTDCHRPGAIVPRDYSLVLHYNLSTTEGGWPVPSFGINCALDRRIVDATGAIVRNGEHDPDGQCCMIGLLHVAKETFAETGATGKCSICGAHFVHGCVWRHVPTGVLINVGHDCADKYEMVADRDDWSAALACAKQRRAALIEQLIRDARLESFYRADPSMRSVLAVDHPILRDMADKVRIWGSLSEKQIAFAVRLAAEAWTPAAPPPPPVERGAHIGEVGKRVTVRATLEHVASYEKTDYRTGDPSTGYIWIFRTVATGDSLVWFTGQPPCNRPNERSAGSGRVSSEPLVCEVKVTIKEHGERDGRCQTTGTRLAVKWPAGLAQTWDEHWARERAELEAQWTAKNAAREAVAA